MLDIHYLVLPAYLHYVDQMLGEKQRTRSKRFSKWLKTALKGVHRQDGGAA